jgi:hypothetical protein
MERNWLKINLLERLMETAEAAEADGSRDAECTLWQPFAQQRLGYGELQTPYCQADGIMASCNAALQTL